MSEAARDLADLAEMLAGAELPGLVFERLMSGPSSSDKLRCEISEFLEVENDQQVADMVSRILAKLEEVGLIEATE